MLILGTTGHKPVRGVVFYQNRSRAGHVWLLGTAFFKFTSYVSLVSIVCIPVRDVSVLLRLLDGGGDRGPPHLLPRQARMERHLPRRNTRTSAPSADTDAVILATGSVRWALRLWQHVHQMTNEHDAGAARTSAIRARSSQACSQQPIASSARAGPATCACSTTATGARAPGPGRRCSLARQRQGGAPRWAFTSARARGRVH